MKLLVFIIVTICMLQYCSTKMVKVDYLAKHLIRPMNGNGNKNRGFMLLGSVDNTIIDIRIALKQNNMDMIMDLFEKVSDPESEMYQNYLSGSEINKIVSLADHEQKLLLKWIYSYPIVSAEIVGDYMDIKASGKVFEDIFNTQLVFVEDSIGRKSVKISNGEYSIDNTVSDLIDFVMSIGRFVIHKRIGAMKMNRGDIEAMNAKRKARDAPSASYDYVIPQTIWNLYNINSKYFIDDADTRHSQAVVEFNNDTSYLKSDLSEFEQDFNITERSVKIVGPYNPNPPDGESSLDIDYVQVGNGAFSWFWTDESGQWIIHFLQELNKYDDADIPKVISVSWGANEVQEGTQYVARADSEAVKTALRGVSLLVASGDDGSSDNDDCQELATGWPAASPVWLSVGATELETGNLKYSQNDPQTPAPCRGQTTCAKYGQENPADFDGGFATGGGFSHFSGRPKYQDQVVGAYLANVSISKPKLFFNSSNRGYPDVAAMGWNLLVRQGGEYVGVGGTSASTPLCAGMLSLINYHLFTLNKRPIGFPNTLLYKMAHDQPNTFKSIGDLDTDNSGECPGNGFTSNPNGWDPVTGLGTLNVGNIMKYIDNNLSMFMDL